MPNNDANWLDERTGDRALMRSHRDEPIPGGSRWRYVFGPVLFSAVLIQAFTGLLMMTAYSPSSASAWGSVFYINNVLAMGWFIRGMHHVGASAVMILLVCHLVRTLLSGAYRTPRGFTWWSGLLLLVLTIGFGHTGYQLPWDQKGYWATKVMTNIASGVPYVGPSVKTLLMGGTEYGNQTLTRLFALHVAVLPILFSLCVYAHLRLTRRHGLTASAADPSNVESYWPAQSFKNSAACALLLAIMVGLVLATGGAPLDAPADPSSADFPARPEWFFLFLFQMLKHFPGRLEWVGSIVVPLTVLAFLFVLPFLDRLLPVRFVHVLACAVVLGLLGGAGYLTWEAVHADASDRQFQEARHRADEARQRALFLAASPAAGVPPAGAGFLLRQDPLTQGRAALETKCLGCHVYGGRGASSGAGEQTAAELRDFGSRAWVRGLLENPADNAYFGKVKGAGGMAEWKKSSRLKGKALEDVADFVASFARIPADQSVEEWLNSPGVSDHPGSAAFQKECGACHEIQGYTEGGLRDAPGLFAWGSPRWLARMIRKPAAPDLYEFFGEAAKMPPFSRDQLTDNDLEMIIRYIKNDYLPMPGTSQSTSLETQASAGPVSGR